MQGNPVDVVRDIYEEWNAGEWAIELFHPDVEWELTAEGTIDQSGTFRGRDALLGYWQRFWARGGRAPDGRSRSSCGWATSR